MTLQNYATLTKGKACRSCDSPLASPITVEHYPHDGGWQVDTFPKRQWLYVVCGNCKYQNALWKLGIPGRKEEEIISRGTKLKMHFLK